MVLGSLVCLIEIRSSVRAAGRGEPDGYALQRLRERWAVDEAAFKTRVPQLMGDA